MAFSKESAKNGYPWQGVLKFMDALFGHPRVVENEHLEPAEPFQHVQAGVRDVGPAQVKHVDVFETFQFNQLGIRDAGGTEVDVRHSNGPPAAAETPRVP